MDSVPNDTVLSSPQDPNNKSDEVPLGYFRKSIQLMKDWKNQVIVSVGAGGTTKITLETGAAEIFGYDLVIGVSYEFRYPLKPVVISATGGCIWIETRLESNINLVFDDPFVEKIVSLYSVLCHSSKESLDCERSGERVLVVGPRNSGKSTCCRTLLNYELQDGRGPSIYIDLDPGQQGIGLPGVISASILNGPIHPVDGCVDTYLEYSLPCGLVNIGDDVELCKRQLENLSDIVAGWLESRPKLRQRNVVINTAGWIEGPGLVFLPFAAQLFQVSTIVVLDDESLYWKIKKASEQFSGKTELVFFKRPKVTSGSETGKGRLSRDMLIRKKFFPDGKSAKVVKTDLRLLTFYQLSSFRRAEMGNGNDRVLCNEIVRPGENLLNHLMYISSASDVDTDVKSFPILGYAVLAGYDLSSSVAWITTTCKENIANVPLILIVTRIEVPGLDGRLFSECVTDDSTEMMVD